MVGRPITGEKVVVEMPGLVIGLDDDCSGATAADVVFIEFKERLD